MTSQYITSHYSTVHPFRIHNPLGRTAVAVAVVVAVTLAAAMAMAMAMAWLCIALHYITVRSFTLLQTLDFWLQTISSRTKP